MQYNFKNSQIDLAKVPVVMGIINATPDSFYVASRNLNRDRLLKVADKMIKEGVTILDVGGESSRPGAVAITIEEEIDRITPVIELLNREFSTVLSIDTRNSKTAQVALENGAEIVNDISAFGDDKMASIVAEYNAVVILMHMQGNPANMQDNPHYDNLIEELTGFFKGIVSLAMEKGVSSDKIWLDPGIGFGKSVADNLAIIKHLTAFKKFNLPLLMGLSRKSFIGEVTGQDIGNRLTGTNLYNLVSLQNGASILRVHDVAATVETIKIYQSLV